MHLNAQLPGLIGVGTVSATAGAGLMSIPKEAFPARDAIVLGGATAIAGGGSYLLESGTARLRRAKHFASVGQRILGEQVARDTFFMHRARISAGLGLFLGATAASLLNLRS